MTGLLKTVGRVGHKVVPKEADPLSHEVIDPAVQKIRFGPKIPKQVDGPVIPLPDEEALDLAKRRARSRRRGARASTVLTGGDEDTVG